MANRHMIVVWDAETSGQVNDFSEAAKKIWTLLRQESKPNTKMLAFAQEIEKYNNIDPSLLKFLKKFAYEVRTNNTVACSLDLPEYGWKGLLKAIIEIAQKYQLIVFDEELFLALLADGSFSPPSRNKLWQEILEDIENKSKFPQNLIELHPLFKQHISILLNKHDFALAEDNTNTRDGIIISYLRKTRDGIHRLSVSSEYSNNIEGGFRFSVYLKIVDNYTSLICSKNNFNYSQIRDNGGILLNIPILLLENENAFDVYSWESLGQLLHIIKNPVLFWSDTALNIQGLDLLLNSNLDTRVKDYVQHNHYMPYCLITAYLANNPNFEELAVSLGTYGKDSGNSWGKFDYDTVKESWPKLVKYLRDEVKPLV